MKDDLFKDVYEYIKLFTPVGWKSDYYKWGDTVRKMFTEGYWSYQCSVGTSRAYMVEN